MGRVYRAWDDQLGRAVAVKVLAPALTTDADRLQRFVTEARAASALNHPNLLTVHDLGRDYIVTELIEGRTLRDHIDARDTDLPARLALMAQVADGLAKAHSSGVVHRDLKPENVMISGDGFAKIVDFGLAKLVEPPLSSDAVTLTGPGTLLGSPGYMSPEQARGVSLDSRTDVFSFGSVLYEVVTGRAAFNGDSTVDTLHAILYDDPLPLGDDVPPELGRIVRRCLAKDPEARYQRMREVAEDLRAVHARPHRVRRRTFWGAAAVLALLAAVLALVVALGTSSAPQAGVAAIDSIAVLPFENRGRDPDLDYLSDGLTESLINALGRAQGVRVISRMSVLRYKGARDDLARIGRELRVETLLLGNVRQRRDRLAIGVELVRADDAAHLWGEQYDIPAADLFLVQAEIAQRVSDRLAWRLGTPGLAPLAGAGDAEAYRLYLRGRYHWNRRAPAELRKAIALYDQSIARSPRFAAAHVGRAEAYALLLNSSSISAADAVPNIERSVANALRLDPRSGEAHIVLGFLRRRDYDWAGAEREIRRGIQLRPNYASAYQWYAMLLAEQGRFEDALRLLEDALAREPMSLPFNGATIVVHYMAGDYAEAERQAQKTLSLDPTFPMPHRWLSRTYVEQGRHEEALREAKAYERLSPSPVATADLAIVHARSGNRAGAVALRASLESLARTTFVSPMDRAAIEIALGRDDEAYRLLEEAFAAGVDGLAFIHTDPRFARLRGQPRFATLVRRLKL